VAELVVDITTTGATLESNGLKILRDGVILRSQAQLVGSLSAAWDDAALASLRILMSGIEAKDGVRTDRFEEFVTALNHTAP
jgi:ATP phosphoribosyltransferase